MRSFFLVAALSLTLSGIANRVQAAPKLYYCSATGDLWVEQDANLSLVVNIKSLTGSLNAPVSQNGSSVVLDLADIPSFIALISLPPKETYRETYRLGPGTVDAGTPISDLSMEWYGPWGAPIQKGEVIARCIPEPSSLALAAISVAGLALAARRRAA